MLTPAELDRAHVVLVNSRNPLNIGAAARAMSNFGFPHLRVEMCIRDRYIQQWSTSLEKQLGTQTTLEVGYLGAGGFHLQRSHLVNLSLIHI